MKKAMNIKKNTHSLKTNFKAKDKQITVNTDIAFNYFLHYSFYYKGKSYKGLIHERDFNPYNLLAFVRYITKSKSLGIKIHHSQRLLDVINKAKQSVNSKTGSDE